MTQNEKTCGMCSKFIGGGDWDLCCSERHNPQHYPFGFLCYETTPACEKFVPKPQTKPTPSTNPVTYTLEEFYGKVFSGEICTGSGYGYFVSENGDVLDDASPTPFGFRFAKRRGYELVRWHTSHRCSH